MIIGNQQKNSLSPLPILQVINQSTPKEISEGRYIARLAQTTSEIESALRLRYEVFHLELHAQINNEASGLEYDEYDAVCKHLLVVDKVTNQTIGTYRLNSIETARNARGFYSYTDFSIEDLPLEVLNQAVEIGRACIAPEHRNSKVLFLLWKGLLNYLVTSRKRYFFGCSSFFTRDCAVGAKVFRQFERQGLIHPNIKVQPRPERMFSVEQAASESDRVEIPGLFNLYLKVGAKICGTPALDAEFGTIDFFVLFDLLVMSEKYRKMFFRS